MAQLFNIQDDKVVINKLALKYLEGAVIHAGTFDIVGNASVQSNLTVAGTITADTVNVKNLVTDSGSLASVGQWEFDNEGELNGKGLNWAWGENRTRLMYRTGGRITLNADFDLSKGKTFKIDNTEVISTTALGPTITKSNLKQIGTLSTLTVLGTTTIGEFAYFNPNFNRLGLGTDEPGASLTIVDNDVEIALGSPKYGVGQIGVVSNHDFALITDNIARVTVKNHGEVHIGDEQGRNGVLRVFGTFYADNVVSDTRVDRTSPLEFKATRDTSIYGLGLVWSGDGNRKQFVMKPDDRLWSSESIDLADGRVYSINGETVLSSGRLGDRILESSLTSVGILSTLTVAGTATLDSVTASAITVNALSAARLENNSNFTISVSGGESFYADENEIALGNKQNTRRPVKVFGQLTVGVNNPDPDVSFAVNGNVSFGNKKFVNGLTAPTSGTFSKGDICWNQDPKSDSYVGWICIVAGAPGQWAPFGTIGRQ